MFVCCDVSSTRCTHSLGKDILFMIEVVLVFLNIVPHMVPRGNNHTLSNDNNNFFTPNSNNIFVIVIHHQYFFIYTMVYLRQPIPTLSFIVLLSVASLTGATQELTSETYKAFVDSGMIIYISLGY